MDRNSKGQFIKVTKVIVTCPECGLEFLMYPSDYKRGRRFCNSICASKYNSKNHRGKQHHRYTQKNCFCLSCGKLFYDIPSKNRRFCSHKCNNIWQANNRESLCGKDNPNWKGGKTSEIKCLRSSKKYKRWRLAVFHRDNFTCQDCHSRVKYLNAHHKIPMSEDITKALELDNGITLCVDCHQKRHPKLNLNIKQSEKNAKNRNKIPI